MIFGNEGCSLSFWLLAWNFLINPEVISVSLVAYPANLKMSSADKSHNLPSSRLQCYVTAVCLGFNLVKFWSAHHVISLKLRIKIKK